MKLVTLNLGDLLRSLAGQLPAKTSSDAAIIKIVIQVIRTAE